MLNLKPTGNYCYIQLVDNRVSKILLPDGTTGPEVDVIILAKGPTVPAPIEEGARVVLRDKPNLMPIEPKHKTALIDCGSIMAVIEDGEME